MAEKQSIGKGLSEEYVVRDRIVIIAEMQCGREYGDSAI